MSAHSRRKGSDAERELARLLMDELGVRLRRRLDQSRDAGHDLALDPDEDGDGAAAIARYAIEVKRYTKALPGAISAWWGQAAHQAATAGLVPVLAFRADRRPWRFVLPLSELLPTVPTWADIEYCAVLSLKGFATLVRERANDPTPQRNEAELGAASTREHDTINDDLVDDLPDGFEPPELEVEDLPEALQDVAELVGVRGALRLVERFGGVRVYCPLAEHLGPAHPLVELLGQAAAERLCRRYAQEAIPIPRARATLQLLRDRALLADREDGASISQLARRYDLGERRVCEILAKPKPASSRRRSPPTRIGD